VPPVRDMLQFGFRRTHAAASTPITSSRLRYAVDCKSPNLVPSRGMSTLSWNQASVNREGLSEQAPAHGFPSGHRTVQWPVTD
jgi:hypothetical protein